MSRRHPLALAAVLVLLTGCSAADAPAAQAPSEASVPPAASPGASPVPASPSPAPSAPAPLTQEQLRVETDRALAVPGPEVVVVGTLGFPVRADGLPGPDFGTFGAAGVEQAYDAALASLEVLLRDPALLRFDRPRTAEDLAAVTALIHPEFRPTYDQYLAAFLGSASNAPDLPAPGADAAASIRDLQLLTALFIGTREADAATRTDGTDAADRFSGFGGDGASAYGELEVTQPSANLPSADSVLVSFGFSSLYNAVGREGSLKTAAVVADVFQLEMKRSGRRWLVAGFAVDGREVRVVDRRP